MFVLCIHFLHYFKHHTYSANCECQKLDHAEDKTLRWAGHLKKQMVKVHISAPLLETTATEIYNAVKFRHLPGPLHLYCLPTLVVLYHIISEMH